MKASATVINFEGDIIAAYNSKNNNQNKTIKATVTKPVTLEGAKTIGNAVGTQAKQATASEKQETNENLRPNSSWQKGCPTKKQRNKKTKPNNFLNFNGNEERSSTCTITAKMTANERNEHFHSPSNLPLSKTTKSQANFVCLAAAAAFAATVVSSAHASAAYSLSTQENESFGYYEDHAGAVNRSLLLTTLTSEAEGADATANITFGNTTSAIVTTSNVADDEDWSHFYDLILSWRGICLIAVFSTFIVITIIGNTLVILAVITTRRLKTVTNCFVMSLAVADLLVGIFVMPPAVAVHLIGSWQLGWVLCDIWISLDVLLCTASILSLCAISVDRYLAVTQPLTYSRKRRSKRLALIMILIVWILALAITCPPMLGWYEPGRRDLSECRYNQNEGYVIFSAMGSFFIPMAVMIYVYTRISCVIASRHDNMTDISVHNKKFKRYTAADVDNEIDHDLSEPELSSNQKKQAAARTFSNQTIVKELHEVMLSDSGENNGGSGGGPGIGGLSGCNSKTATHCHSLLVLPTGNVNKNSCYELTRPSSFRRSPTPSATVSSTGMSSIDGDIEETQKKHQQHHWTTNVHTRTHSMRHQQPHQTLQQHRSQQHLNVPIGVGGLTTSPHNQHHHQQPADTTQIRQTRIYQHHSQHHHTKSLTNRISSLKKENKTTQTLSIVVGGFIACWLPFFVYYLITPFLEEHQVSATFAKALTWLGWFNSAINPFIYAFYSVDFRAAFWRLTCKRFFSNSSKPQFPSNTMSIRR